MSGSGAARRPMRCYQLVDFGSPLAERNSLAPAPTGTEVLLRVTGAGVCHSDVHICGGFYDLGHGKSASLANRVFLPLTPGHESAGEVVALGPDAAGVPVGQSCLVCAWIGCGDCDVCTTGEEHLCATPKFLGVNKDGGYADYMMVPHPRYLIDLEGMDPAEAAPYACSGVTTYSALKKLSAVIESQPIVVIGAGGLGLMSLGMLRLLDGVGAVVVDLDPAKREAALAAGALAVVDPRAPGAAAQIRAAVGAPIRGVVDFVGSGETASLGFDLLAKGGKLVIVGLYGGAMSLSVMLVPSKAVTIQGSYVGNVAEMREMMALVRHVKLLPIPITRRPLSEVNAALTELRDGQVVGRIVLVP